MKKIITTCLLVSACSLNAQVYDSTVDGFASNDGSAPTQLTFAVGSNVVSGEVTASTDINTRDFFTFTIGADQALSAINLDSLTVFEPNGAPSLDPGFFALVSGSTSATPGVGFTNLGGNLFDPSNVGVDLLTLPTTTSSGTGATGIPTTIGAGDYTFVIQQTGSELSLYTLDFVVETIPEPSTATLLGLGMLGLLSRRKL